MPSALAALSLAAQDAACPNYHTDTQATKIGTIFERPQIATTLEDACDGKLIIQKEAKLSLQMLQHMVNWTYIHNPFATPTVNFFTPADAKLSWPTAAKSTA